MKILLINLPIRELDNPSFPLGLGYIAAVMRKAGHTVQVLDAAAYRYRRNEILTKIDEYQFDVIGLGGLVTLFEYFKWITHKIKDKYPNIPIIAGGSVVSSLPRLFMEKTATDIGVLSEGEPVIIKLLDSIKNGTTMDSINGIIYKDSANNIKLNPIIERIENLDEIPFPAYDLFPMDIYLKYPLEWGIKNYSGSRRYIKMLGSRGCPFNCTYCHRNFGNKYTHRSPENIIKEMDFLNKSYGIALFNFVDETFTVNQEHTKRFCDLLIAQGSKYAWCCLTRVDLVDKQLIKKMKDAGCITANFGLETGSQTMLDNYNKRVTVKQMEQAIKWSKQVGFTLSYTFMIGGPGETKQTVQETIDFCKRMDIPATFFITTPYPGTILYDKLKKENVMLDDEEYLKKLSSAGDAINLNFNVSGLEDGMLLALRDQATQEINHTYHLKHPKEWIADYIGWLRFVATTLRNIYRTEGISSVFSTIKNKLMGKKTNIFVINNSGD